MAFFCKAENVNQKKSSTPVPILKKDPLEANNKAMAIITQSLARISKDKSNSASPVWKKVQGKDVASYKPIFDGMDEWDKVDEMVAIGRRIYDRSEVEVSTSNLFFTGPKLHSIDY